MITDEQAVAAQFQAFAALAAHQLGEAVALMRGGAGALDEARDRLGPGGDDALRALNAGSDRAQRFVDDLLDLVASGGPPADELPSDLATACAVALAELEPAVRRAGADVHCEPIPTAALEAAGAERLFVHVLRSALAAGARRIRVSGVRRAADIVVQITDDGAPPRPETSPLELFARPRGRGPLVGAGVSLIVARQIVERAGGDIEVVAPAGLGTTVTIRVPRARPASLR